MENDNDINGSFVYFDKDFFECPQNSTVLVRVYAPLNMSDEKFRLIHLKSIKKFDIHPPVWISFGKGQIEWKVFDEVVTSSTKESNTLNLFLNSCNKKADDGYFVFFSTILSENGSSLDYKEARYRLDIASGIVALYFGRNLVPKILIETSASVNDAGLNITPETRRFPLITDGPFISTEKWQEIFDSISRLRAMKLNKANQIERAISVFREALNSEQGYIYYWTALDVLTDSNAGESKVISKLQQCYRLGSANEVKDKFAVLKLKNIRNELIHQGVSYTVPGDIERFTQLMFIDILRHELGLQHVGYMERLLTTPGYDLSSIGLGLTG